MQLNRIQSHQQFTGKMLFVSQNGHHFTEQVELYFPKELKNELAEIRNIIMEKPYDLFISQDVKYPEYYKFNANENYKSVTPKTDSSLAVVVHNSIIKDVLTDAVKHAMSLYEKVIK